MILNSDLNKRISDLQLQVLRGDQEEDAFGRMLELIINSGESEFGFVGELVESSQHTERLRIRAITNIATTEEMLAMHTDFVKGEKFFESGPILIGEVLRTHEIVVSNDVLNDDRSGQLPKDHQRIKRFIGLPLIHDTTMVGMVGLANRPMPYDELFVKLLEPLLVTCTTLLVVYKERRQRKEKETLLADMRHNIDLMAAAFRFAQDGMIITDKNGNIIEVNESFCRDSGYSRDFLIGRNPRILRSGI